MRLGVAPGALASLLTCVPAEPAAGQEASVSIGGFLTAGLGYIDADEVGEDAEDDLNDVFIVRDGEIIPQFSLTADNGLTFSIEVEIETADDGDLIDEAFAAVEGGFGRFEIGETDGAADAFAGSGITAYVFTSATDATGLLFDYYSGDVGFTRDASGENTGDAIKVSYYTPQVAGLQAGVSFAPSVASEDGPASSLADETNAVELGAQFDGAVGAFGLRVGAGYASDVAAGEDDDSAAGGGVLVSRGGVELGANLGWNEGYGGLDDQQILGLGAAYATGLWLTGASFIHVLDGPADGTIGLAAEVTYALAPGVTLGAVGEFGDREAVRPGDEDPGRNVAAGVFLGLNF